MNANAENKQMESLSVQDNIMKSDVPGATLFSENSIQETVTVADTRFHKWKNKFYPRCTYVLEESYPKSEAFYQWLRQNGQESERIKEDAGRRGSNVHYAVQLLSSGQKIFKESYRDDEWEMILSWVEWYREYTPEIVSSEQMVFDKKLKVVGTYDAVLRNQAGEYILVDFKTARTIQPHFFLQASFYAKNCGYDISCTAILQLGTKHRCGYKYELHTKEEVEKDYKMFANCKKIFDYKLGDIKPHHKEYPVSIKI